METAKQNGPPGIFVRLGIAAVFCSLVASQLMAQEDFAGKAPSVHMSPVSIVSIVRGKPSQIPLEFHISQGYHINSNTPSEEYLIPTALKLDPPTDLVVGRITYPEGKDITLPFSPDAKLNVYSGTFGLAVTVRPLASVIPGKYMLRGRLRYQACDNAACYPPRELPLAFEVKVTKGPPPPHHNPAQSPHAHY